MQQIGKIVSTHGLKGEVILVHELDPKTSFATWDCLMIELAPKSYIPFFIERIEAISSNECICKLEDIHAKEEAKLILNKTVFSSINYTVKSNSDNDWAAFIGYEIIADKRSIGKIADVLQVSVNIMYQIMVGEKEILIPAPEEFIEKIDSQAKKLYMKLPDGLLDL